MSRHHIVKRNRGQEAISCHHVGCSEVPESALIQVTRNCNLKCLHCSQDSHYSEHVESQDSGSLDFWGGLFANLAELGIRRIRFTGGEPFLYPNLMQIAFRARELGLCVSFVTNGTRISDYEIRWLSRLAPESIWITLHGYDSKSSQALTGSKDYFDKALHSMSSLTSTGVDVGAYYLLGDHNASTLQDAIMLLVGNGVKRIKILQLTFQERALKNRFCRPLSSNNLEIALETLKRIRRDIPGIVVKITLGTGQQEVFARMGFSLKSRYPCRLGSKIPWAVDYSGNIYECCLLMNERQGVIFNAFDVASMRDWLDCPKSVTSRETLNYCTALANHPENDIDHCKLSFCCPLTYVEVLH